jgi:putative transposase
MAQPCTPFNATERQIVKQDVLFWHKTKRHVHAVTVMPTHVHVLATPLEAREGEWYSLSEILHSVKRASARHVNRLRGTEGPLWLGESYDHMIRNETEWSAAFDYILGDAPEDGFTDDPYDYDGFWCEGMEGSANEPDVSAGAEGPGRRIAEGTFARRRRRLPHWETPGACYHVVFSLIGHRPSPPSPPEIMQRSAQVRAPGSSP